VEETQKDSAKENEQSLTIVCDVIAEWVDTVANDILEEEAPFQELTGCSDVEVWETMSMCSFEDWGEGDVLDFAPPSTFYVHEPVCAASPIMAETIVLPTKQETLAPETEGRQELSLAPSPLMASPTASPSSRSSTPGRSVRHRRRIIGGVVRPVSPAFSSPSPSWGGAAACQGHVGHEVTAEGASTCSHTSLRPCSAMKRAASTSALALDLGAEVGKLAAPIPPAAPVAAPVPVYGHDMSQVQFHITASSERKCVKSKSLGSLHVTSSKNGLGLAAPMLSTKKGLLPALSDGLSSKAELIAWSVSMTKPKLGGLSLAF